MLENWKRLTIYLLIMITEIVNIILTIMEAKTILDIQKEDNIFQILWVQEMKLVVASNTI